MDLNSFFNATDQSFPIINYDQGKSYKEWGESHGEQFKDGIKELAEIRRGLILAMTPIRDDAFEQLALEQLEMTRVIAPDIVEEIEGIARGSGVSVDRIVGINNYSNFGDLHVDEGNQIRKHKSGRFYEQSKGILRPNEGGLSVQIQDNGQVTTGNLLNTHGSAKNYLCVINIPEIPIGPPPSDGSKPEKITNALLFSTIGCVGLAGVNGMAQYVCANHFEVNNAKPGIIWTALVRKLLQQKELGSMRDLLTKAPFTGGNTYHLASTSGGEIWETAPGICEKVQELEENEDRRIFHTSQPTHEKLLEVKGHDDSSDFEEYDLYNIEASAKTLHELLQRKIDVATDYHDTMKLLRDHEDYPRSICFHFDNGAQDPTQTCGGLVADLEQQMFRIWRGCPQNDENYIQYEFKLVFDDIKWEKTFVREMTEDIDEAGPKKKNKIFTFLNSLVPR